MLAIEHDLVMKEEGREEGIEALILDNLEESISPERIILKLQKRFNLSEDQANEKFNSFIITGTKHIEW